MKVLKGGLADGGFVCVWCAASFSTRVELEGHWLRNPGCSHNRMASNQTQSKYLDVVVDPATGKEVPPRMLGQETLDRIKDD